MRQVSSKALDSLTRREAEFIEPMDCAPVSKLPDGSKWLFEIKLDGYRAIGVRTGLKRFCTLGTSRTQQAILRQLNVTSTGAMIVTVFPFETCEGLNRHCRTISIARSVNRR